MGKFFGAGRGGAGWQNQYKSLRPKNNVVIGLWLKNKFTFVVLMAFVARMDTRVNSLCACASERANIVDVSTSSVIADCAAAVVCDDMFVTI